MKLLSMIRNVDLFEDEISGRTANDGEGKDKCLGQWQ